MPDLELYGTASCPYTREMREWLEWTGREFVEYDVEADAGARNRLRAFGDGQRTVPVLVEAGEVVQIGWQGRGCIVSVEPAE
ncbi:MAG: glutathione S-transferase N-terminal domain-containing protein [Acidobacteria bacterium]|jgi:glutaredoxin 3|nr:glutathione S-transferase N-terminal domain-containing protein [Acidobacteriota bacterium]